MKGKLLGAAAGLALAGGAVWFVRSPAEQPTAPPPRPFPRPAAAAERAVEADPLPPSAEAAPSPKRPDALDARRATLRTSVADPARPEPVRVRDLLSLRQLHGVTPEIARSLLPILRGSADPTTRERIVLGLDAVDDPEVRAEIVARLAADPAPRVREAAARALARRRDEPDVRALLEAARDGDSDGDVRKAALRSLEARPRPGFRSSEKR